MLTLYGISNCDTIKKARRCLEQQGADYHFHDYRKQGLDEARLRDWCRDLGWESLLNRRGTTWRRLDEGERENLDEDKAVRLMLANPSLIKRPLLDTGAQRILGFDEKRWKSLL